MELHLTEKVAVVTGASKGIGLVVSEVLAREGARVGAGVLPDRLSLSREAVTGCYRAGMPTQRRAAARYRWMSCTAVEPSPTAAATRLTEPLRTSPMANTPGWLVSNRIGSRSRHTSLSSASGLRSGPVLTKPAASSV